MSLRCPSQGTSDLGQCEKRWLHTGWHKHGGTTWNDSQWLGGRSWLLKPWIYVQRLRGRL